MAIKRPDLDRAEGRDCGEGQHGGEALRTKNAKAITRAEAEHMGRVKESGCAVCGEGGPVEAHHIRQGAHFTVVGLCTACHRGPLGWHGDKTMWRIRKMDELSALNETLRRLAV